MERLSKEKETTISKYEKLLTTTKERHDHELQNLIAKSSQEIKRLETKHQLELDDLRRSILIENNETFQALSDKFVKKQKELENQNKLALVSKDEEIGKLERQLSNANNEVERLEKANLDNQKGLGSASSHITSLEESLKKAKQDLFETTEQLNAAKVKAEHSEVNFDHLLFIMPYLSLNRNSKGLTMRMLRNLQLQDERFCSNSLTNSMNRCKGFHLPHCHVTNFYRLGFEKFGWITEGVHQTRSAYLC